MVCGMMKMTLEEIQKLLAEDAESASCTFVVADQPSVGIVLLPLDGTFERFKAEFIEQCGDHPEYLVGVLRLRLCAPNVLAGCNAVQWAGKELRSWLAAYASVLTTALYQEMHKSYDNIALVERGRDFTPPLRVEDCAKFRSVAKDILAGLSSYQEPKRTPSQMA